MQQALDTRLHPEIEESGAKLPGLSFYEKYAARLMNELAHGVERGFEYLCGELAQRQHSLNPLDREAIWYYALKSLVRETIDNYNPSQKEPDNRLAYMWHNALGLAMILELDPAQGYSSLGAFALALRRTPCTLGEQSALSRSLDQFKLGCKVAALLERVGQIVQK